LNEETNETKSKLFKLDWESMVIRLRKGRFLHTLKRPEPEILLDRDKEIEVEIPIAKDGSYSLPDPTETEEIDAAYYDKIQIEATGYEGPIPAQHKASAFQGLYIREIYIPEECDIFGSEITVLEEIGGSDEPDFTITHVIAQPEESDLRKLRKKLSNGHIAPDKRGRQKFVRSSSLKTTMQHYSSWMKRVEGATVAGETYSAENRDAFLATVDPLIQQRVINVVVEELTGKLLD
jgi:hypothetical protein